MILKQYTNMQGKTVKNHFILRNSNEKIGDYVLFQSYDTVVGIYLIDYSKMILNTNKYSNTTSKHLKDFKNSMSYKALVEFTENDFNRYIENWIK